MKISVCIISKNEEKYIKQCINSVYDIAYEIIVLDTGSTDKTKEIVREFDKVKLFETIWKDDFSKARNECISYTSGDWILSIDADEIIYSESINVIIELLNQKSKYNIYQALIISSLPNIEIKDCFFRDFLFLNDKNISYTKPIHEHLKGIGLLRKKEDKIKVSNIQKENFEEKYLNYANSLVKALNQENNMLDFCHYLKHLAYLYEKIGNYEKSLEIYYDLLILYNDLNFDKKDNNYHTALLKIIQMEVFYKKYDRALDLCQNILNLLPNDSMTLYYKAICLDKKGNRKQAIKLYKTSLDFIDYNHPNSSFFIKQIKNQLQKTEEVLL